MVGIHERWATAASWIKSLRHPLVAIFRQVQAPREVLLQQIEYQNRIEPRRREEQQVIPTTYLVAMPQVFVTVGVNQFKFRCVTKELIAGGDPHRVIGKFDAAEPSIPATTCEVNVTRIPIDFLLHSLGFKIDQINTTVTLTLLGPSYYRSSNELGQLDGHDPNPSALGNTGCRISRRGSRCASKRFHVCTDPE